MRASLIETSSTTSLPRHREGIEDDLAGFLGPSRRSLCTRPRARVDRTRRRRRWPPERRAAHESACANDHGTHCARAPSRRRAHARAVGRQLPRGGGLNGDRAAFAPRRPSRPSARVLPSAAARRPSMTRGRRPTTRSSALASPPSSRTEVRGERRQRTADESSPREISIPIRSRHSKPSESPLDEEPLTAVDDARGRRRQRPRVEEPRVAMVGSSRRRARRLGGLHFSAAQPLRSRTGLSAPVVFSRDQHGPAARSRTRTRRRSDVATAWLPRSRRRRRGISRTVPSAVRGATLPPGRRHDVRISGAEAAASGRRVRAARIAHTSLTYTRALQIRIAVTSRVRLRRWQDRRMRRRVSSVADAGQREAKAVKALSQRRPRTP